MSRLLTLSVFNLIICAIMTASPLTVYISGSGSGIYRASFDPATGKLGTPEVAAKFGAGSWIASHPSKPILYTSLREPGKQGIASWRMDADGNLVRESEVLLEVGSATHIAINPQGTLLATAHYGGAAGSLMVLDDDGRPKEPALITPHVLETPGPRPQQDQAHPHFVAFTEDGRRVHEVDLGADRIRTYAVSAEPLKQVLMHTVSVPPGNGPRHLAFHPTLPYAYVSEELGSKISAFRYDASTATFDPIQHLDSMNPEVDDPTNNTSHILVHPNGRFVYIGNRGDDSIGVFAIDPDTGAVSLVEAEPVRGHWPRGFTIDPSGRWLIVAGQDSGTVGVLAIDTETGRLSFVRDSVINVPNPVCVLVR